MAQFVGPYELIDKLGSGGMGAVWRAQDSRTGGILALKILRGELSDNADLVKRFEREAGVASRLRHPTIVRAFDAGTDGEVHYMTMELVEGETLFDRVKRGRLSEDEARDVAVAVATALEVAHGARVIHRDIKSANILLGPRGMIKVSDFGIARVLDETQRSYTSTFMGSLPYSAPETFDLHVDERSDLYSLGAVLFEALTGKAPFVAESPLRYMDLHRWEPPDIAAVTAVAPSLAPIIAQLLEKEPRRRPQSATEVLALLRESASAPETVIAPTEDATPTRYASPTRLSGATRVEPRDGAPPGRPPSPAPRWATPPAPIGPRDRTRRVLRIAGGAVAFVAVLGIGGGAYLASRGSGDGGENVLGRSSPTRSVVGAVPTPASPPVVVNPEFERFAPGVIALAGVGPLSIRVACSAVDRGEIGLSLVNALPPGSGLLFDSGSDIDVVEGWNTRDYSFPIDIVWIASEPGGLIVQDVVRDIPPETSGISSPGPVRYALEVNAGAADGLGLVAQQPVTVTSPCAANTISPPPVGVGSGARTVVGVTDSNGLATLHVDAIDIRPGGDVILELAFTNETVAAIPWTSDVGSREIFLTDDRNTIIPSVEVTGAFVQQIPDGLRTGDRLTGTHRFVLPDPAYRGVLTLHYPNHRDISFRVSE